MVATFNVEKKRCYTCKETKLTEDFGIDRSKQDGRQSSCRACRTAKRHASLTKVCNIPTCGKKCSGDYCTTHMGRYYRHGSYLEDVPITRQGAGHLNGNGYRLIYKPEHPSANANGHILEHRYVMSEHLGRPLLAEENVHHINGDRQDNRIENLELWSTSQPRGQRVEDKVVWAKELLALYEPEALTEAHFDC